VYQSLAFGQPTYLSSVLTSHQASDVFLTASATAYRKHILHGQETVSIYIANLHAIFNDILRKKTMGLSFIVDVVRHCDSEPVCHGACS